MSFETKTDLVKGLSMFDAKAAQAIAEFRNTGFNVDAPPPTLMIDGGLAYFDGRIPADITVLHDGELGHLLSLLANWIYYVNGRLAIADVLARTAKEKLDFAEACLRLSLGDKDDSGHRYSIPDKNQRVAVDSRYIELNSDYIYKDSVYRFAKAQSDSASSAYSAVSRRITQRQNEQNMSQGPRSSHPAGTVIPNYQSLKPRCQTCGQQGCTVHTK